MNVNLMSSYYVGCCKYRHSSEMTCRLSCVNRLMVNLSHLKIRSTYRKMLYTNVFSMLLKFFELFYHDSCLSRLVTMHKCNAVPGVLQNKFTMSNTAKHMELVM